MHEFKKKKKAKDKNDQWNQFKILEDWLRQSCNFLRQIFSVLPSTEGLVS